MLKNGEGPKTTIRTLHICRVAVLCQGRYKMITLVIPPSSFLLDEKVFMSLGVLKVAASLEQRGHKVEVLDLSGVKNFLEVVSDYANSHAVSHYGITATTPQMPSSFKIAQVLKDTGAKLILGGPHVTLVNAALKKGSLRASQPMRKMEEVFDCLVAGDGEESIFIAIGNNGPKLVDADNRKSELFLTNIGLEKTPFPARHLIDVGSYHYLIDGVPALSLIAQLGCPFGCGFCGGRSSAMLRQIRTRSSQSIVDEMTFIYKTYGIRGFMLHDDELNVNPKIVELMNLIADTQDKLGTEWRMRGFVKSELFTEAQAKAMYRAGFRWLLTGFESGSPRILTNINKRATREENSRCVELAHGAGLKIKALMSIGHPGESYETVRETKEWVLETKPDDFDVTIITCYPGTPYFDEAIPFSGGYVYTYAKTGDKLYQVDVDHSEIEDYYKGIPGVGYHSYVFTDDLSAEELVRLRDEAEADIRSKLCIPYPKAASELLYEHSMGQ